MNHSARRAIFVAAIVVLALGAGALYVRAGSEITHPATGCGMPEHMTLDASEPGAMAGCPGHSAMSKSAQVVLSGKVLDVNRDKGTVTLRVELPADKSALSAIKKGDTVAATVALGKDGKIAATALSTGNTATFSITGIQCQACADRIQTALKAVPGVSQAAVNANPPSAVVTFDPSKTNVVALKDVVCKTEPIHKGMPFGVTE